MKDNSRIAFNSAIIFIRLCIVTIISLIAARVVLQALGVSDFGLYNVVGGIVTILNVVNTAMVTTSYRYIAFEMGKKEEGNVNKIFNSCLAIHFVFGILILVLGFSIGEWYVNNYLNVAPNSLSDARFVLRISVLTTMITTIFVPFQGLLTAYERFYIPAIFDVVCQSLKLIALFALLYFPYEKIRTYSVIMLFYNTIYATLYIIYCHHNFLKDIKLKIQRDWKLYKEMFAFSWWILFGAGACIGKTQGSAMIINYFFGTVVNAAFAVANQVDSFIMMFSRMLNQSAVPQITKNYGVGNINRSIKLASYISKYTFILMSLVVFPIILEMDFFLNIWLDKVPDGSIIFCKLMVLGALIGCMGEGLPALTQASGKIKIFQLVLSTIFLMGLPISFVCYKFGAPTYCILIVYIAIDLFITFLRLWLLKIILDIDIKFLIKTSYSKMVYISIPLIIAYFLYDPTSVSIFHHVISIILMEIYLVFIIVLLGLDKTERILILQFLKKVKHYRCKR